MKSSRKLKLNTRFIWWMRKILYLWVKSKGLPSAGIKDLEIDPNLPTCYVLKVATFLDLLVLDHHCEKEGLPAPRLKRSLIETAGEGAYIYLDPAGIVQRKKKSKEIPKPLVNVLNRVENDNLDLQLIPVSVFWGRYPGNDDKSLWKLLFLDAERGSLLQRFFTMIFQGRNVMCSFGRPMRLKDILETEKKAGLSTEQVGKKVRRVLRVHFHRQKTSVMGPVLYDRRLMMRKIVEGPEIQEFIKQQAGEEGKSKEKLARKSYAAVEEIAASYNYGVVKFLDILLDWVWKKSFRDGIKFSNVERIRKYSEDHEIIYVPCHRSHVDYLALPWVLYRQGVLTPHTAAGINLDFWPAGPLLRRGGAFFMRRSFKGNRLYALTFTKYVETLMERGFPITFFPEGKRSRSGKMLPPATGFLSMIVNGYLTSHLKPVVFVPLYISYDRVMEGKSYARELRGESKRAESLGQLLKIFKAFRSNFGAIWLSVGEPIELTPLLNAKLPGWTQAGKMENSEKRRFSQEFVHDLAFDLIKRINKSVTVNPSSLVILILSSLPQNALAETDLEKTYSLLMEMAAQLGFQIPESEERAFRSTIDKVAAVANLKRFQHPDGDVIHLGDGREEFYSFYRNNILHVFSVPSLICCLFQHQDSIPRTELMNQVELIYPLLAHDFFLPTWDSGGREMSETVLGSLIENRVLVENSDCLIRGAIGSQGYSFLSVLAWIHFRELESVALALAMIDKLTPAGQGVSESALEERFNVTVKRLSLLKGNMRDPSFDVKWGQVRKRLIDCKWVDLQEDVISLAKSHEKNVEAAVGLLAPDILTSLAANPQADGLN